MSRTKERGFRDDRDDAFFLELLPFLYRYIRVEHMPRRKRGDGKGARAMKALDLESYWNWLPTFRVVAERENLQEASRMLQLSASSVSRTIRLLEGELGRALFSRDGGRMHINPAGRVLLEAVRRSMRLVDDGAVSLRGLEARGPVRMSLPRSLLTVVALPAILRTRAADPSACFYISHGADARAVAAGLVDLAIVCAPPRSVDDVEVHRLGELPIAVYCGRDHPLWSKRTSSFADLATHAFITEVDDAIDVACWPAEHRKRVAIELADPAFVLASCIASLALAVLPKAVARKAVESAQLRPLDGIVLKAQPIFALRRPRLVDDRAEALLRDIRSSLRSFGSDSSSA